MNFYQTLVNIVTNWLQVTNEVIQFFNRPLWSGGIAPIQILTFYGLSILIVIFVAHLLT